MQTAEPLKKRNFKRMPALAVTMILIPVYRLTDYELSTVTRLSHPQSLSKKLKKPGLLFVSIFI